MLLPWLNAINMIGYLQFILDSFSPGMVHLIQQRPRREIWLVAAERLMIAHKISKDSWKPTAVALGSPHTILI